MIMEKGVGFGITIVELIAGVFRITGENLKGGRVVDSCADRDLCISNNIFQGQKWT